MTYWTIATAALWSALIIYTQSLCLGLSLLSAILFFACGNVFERVGIYSLPVVRGGMLTVFCATFILIGLAINVYIGGLIAAFFVGMCSAGFLFGADK